MVSIENWAQAAQADVGLSFYIICVARWETVPSGMFSPAKIQISLGYAQSDKNLHWGHFGYFVCFFFCFFFVFLFFCYRKDNALTWDEAAAVVNGYKEHLDTLTNPFILSLADSEVVKVQEYLEMYDLTKGSSDVVSISSISVLAFAFFFLIYLC